MMRYIKYAFNLFCSRIILCSFMIIEMSILLIALNTIIGNFNSRNMLYAPFEKYLTSGGYYVVSTIGTISTAEDIEQFEEDNNNLEAAFKNMMDDMQGDVEMIAIYDYSAKACDKNGMKVADAHITFLPDEVYDKITFPLSSGSYRSAVVTADGYLSVGDTIKVGAISEKEIKISGVLTTDTYIPSFNVGTPISEGAPGFYTVYSSGTKSAQQAIIEEMTGQEVNSCEILAPLSSISDLSDLDKENIYPNGFRMFVYGKNMTDEQREHNDSILSRRGSSFSGINEKSLIYVKEELNKVLPIFVCVTIVSLMGIICCCCIVTIRNTYTNSVCYMLGASVKDCICINMLLSFMIAIISSVLTICYLKIVAVTKITDQLGMVIQINNLYISLAFVMFILVVSQIISIIVFAYHTPRELLIKK